MDTLSDRHISVLRDLPPREAEDIRSAAVGVVTAPAISGTSSPSSVQPDAVRIPLPGEPDCEARFAPDLCDPNFPVKHVSYSAAKRAFDVLFASAAVFVTSPIMLVVALCIKLTDRGPVFFKQVRVGTGGRYFWCLKFRSMCVDAEEKKKQLMHLNEVSGPVFKIKHDPRVTRIGAFIRKLSLDELPQFFNVISGDMSIVGPRPPLPSEVIKYSAYQRGRLAVKPGITCIWQISGRSDISFDRWVELDLQYINSMSLMNDITIVAKTIPAVVKGSGAH